MLLSFSNVSFSYNKNFKVLKNISFNIEKGEKIALLGLNGAGKSTLILHTNGLLLPNEGQVLVNGLNTRGNSLKEIRKKIGIVFQNPDDQLFMPTVFEDVAFGPRNMNIGESEVEQRVKNALEATNTLHLKDKSPYELSGGQKKSVCIATVLSMSPELLVMDEPTSGLDYKASDNFISIVENLEQALLLSTHDLDLARKLCRRALVLKDGTLVFDGKISELKNPYSLF